MTKTVRVYDSELGYLGSMRKNYRNRDLDERVRTIKEREDGEKEYDWDELYERVRREEQNDA